MNESKMRSLIASRFPGISLHALGEFEKLVSGNTVIDGAELGRLGLAYRTTWKLKNRWSLSLEGVKFSRLENNE